MNAPSEPTTLAEVIDQYRGGGYDGDLGVADAGVECHSCGTTTPAAEATIDSSRRLEGASDPADMATVAALHCPSCGRGGVLVVRYGPEASAAEADLLIRIRDGRRDGDAGFTTPAETDGSDVAVLDPDAPGTSLFREGDAVEPNEPA